jgi:hypothetical protein
MSWYLDHIDESAGQRPSSLQERLQIADDPGPSATTSTVEFTGSRGGHQRRTLELVRYRDTAESGARRLDFPRNSGESSALFCSEKRLRPLFFTGIHFFYPGLSSGPRVPTPGAR